MYKISYQLLKFNEKVSPNQDLFRLTLETRLGTPCRYITLRIQSSPYKQTQCSIICTVTPANSFIFSFVALTKIDTIVVRKMSYMYDQNAKSFVLIVKLVNIIKTTV